MTRVLIAVDETEQSVVAARTAYKLFGEDADYTVINVAKDAPVYWGDDPLGAGYAYPLAIPAVGAGIEMDVRNVSWPFVSPCIPSTS